MSAEEGKAWRDQDEVNPPLEFPDESAVEITIKWPNAEGELTGVSFETWKELMEDPKLQEHIQLARAANRLHPDKLFKVLITTEGISLKECE